MNPSSTLAGGLKKIYSSGDIVKYLCKQSWARNYSKKYLLSATNISSVFPEFYFGGNGGINKPGYLEKSAYLKVSNSLYLLSTLISPKLSYPTIL